MLLQSRTDHIYRNYVYNRKIKTTANVTVRLSCDTMTWWFDFQAHTQPVFTYSKTLIKKSEECVKYVQS